ncbi:UxaA family hydrolase [Bosea sp. AS-1]|uniref:UxaA family hydrolase n=1 Tax=Bosea sp. AS-1 TaxID=2015316 RepID=UPI000B772003|nr:UxaA family hydrolase [Bosea sp. AS-1]
MRPFQGYLRADGRVGVRNHMLILGINGLALRSSERIARNLPGSLLVATSAGRGQVEPDLGLHLDQLVGLGRNPNVGAVLVVGVDQATSDDVAARIALSGKPVASVSFAECGEDALAISDLGLRRATELSRAASRARRTRVEPTALVVAVECGHSDATSGLASNPIVGAAVDRLVAAGACVIVGETVEWLGAEHLLARRAADADVAARIHAAVAGREAIAIASGRSLTGNNPGEENIKGGLSTIEEKSLGAIVKSGTGTIAGMLGVAEAPPGPGLYLMDGPSFSPDSMTGFAAAGATIMLFTTGPGNSFASAIAPTLKISAHPETVTRLPAQIDFDASPILAGAETLAEGSERLVEAVLDVADGTLTLGEIVGEGLEVPTRIRGSL